MSDKLTLFSGPVAGEWELWPKSSNERISGTIKGKRYTRQ